MYVVMMMAGQGRGQSIATWTTVVLSLSECVMHRYGSAVTRRTVGEAEDTFPSFASVTPRAAHDAL